MYMQILNDMSENYVFIVQQLNVESTVRHKNLKVFTCAIHILDIK